MSITRYSAYHSGNPNKLGIWDDPNGHWVQYADHVAEIERLTTILAEASLAMLAERDEAWQAGVDQMREACIAAVEALPPWHNQALLHKVEDVLAVLKEVQP